MTFIAVALALAVFAAIALRQESVTVSNQDAGNKIFPGLISKVNDVALISVQKDAQTLTIKRNDNQWQVVDKDGYPANITKVKQTILGIADFETVEAKTKKPENYKQLDVDDKASVVTLQDAANQTLASLILGKVIDGGFSANSKAKMYVRKKDDAQVWLVKGELHAEPVATDWLADDIMNIDAERVQRVSIQSADNKSYSITKNLAEDKHFALTEIPKGKQLKSETSADELARALQGLRLADVQKAGKVEFNPEKTSHAEYQTFDGLVVSADITENENKKYVKLSARFDPAVRKEPAAEVKTDAAKDNAVATSTTAANPHDKPASPDAPPAKPLKEISAVQQEAAELNEKLSPWVFTLPQNKTLLMQKAEADLLKDAK